MGQTDNEQKFQEFLEDFKIAYKANTEEEPLKPIIAYSIEPELNSVQWKQQGRTVRTCDGYFIFLPDFYLTDFDIYVEVMAGDTPQEYKKRRKTSDLNMIDYITVDLTAPAEYWVPHFFRWLNYLGTRKLASVDKKKEKLDAILKLAIERSIDVEVDYGKYLDF